MEPFTLLINETFIDATYLASRLRTQCALLSVEGDVEKIPLHGVVGIVSPLITAKSPIQFQKTHRHHAAVCGELASCMHIAYEQWVFAQLLRQQKKNKENRAFPPQHASEIMEYALSTHDLSVRAQRIAYLIDDLHPYIGTYASLHVEGFLRFRAVRYRNALRVALEHALIHWHAEKTMRERAGLLRAFVQSQEARLTTVHAIHDKDDDRVTLWNEQYQKIPMEPFAMLEWTSTEQSWQCEDALLCTLLHVMPHKLIIHTATPHKPIIRTLFHIFEGRVEVTADDVDVCLT